MWDLTTSTCEVDEGKVIGSLRGGALLQSNFPKKKTYLCRATWTLRHLG